MDGGLFLKLPAAAGRVDTLSHPQRDPDGATRGAGLTLRSVDSTIGA
jgi:hypothetical protein